uniref:Uncharacterized protein n=1 Tax=Gossypium raimondii TaxID=29730 RepID=A0A0D2US31_GOSRA|nr:hypothetical protein B456_009G224900 [Gossypium raimondii]
MVEPLKKKKAKKAGYYFLRLYFFSREKRGKGRKIKMRFMSKMGIANKLYNILLIFVGFKEKAGEKPFSTLALFRFW